MERTRSRFEDIGQGWHTVRLETMPSLGVASLQRRDQRCGSLRPAVERSLPLEGRRPINAGRLAAPVAAGEVEEGKRAVTPCSTSYAWAQKDRAGESWR